MSAGNSAHAVIEAGDGDAALRRRASPPRILLSTRIGFCAAPPNRPECRSRSAQVSLHLFVDQPAQRRGDRRRLRVPHAGVADEREIEFEFVGVVAHEAEQILRAALLLAFDHHRDRQRQCSGHRLVGAARLDEGHGLAFVVAGAARDDDLATVGQRLDPRLERRRGPKLKRINRLHVVMAVEQDVRRALALPLPRFADHHRMARGRPHLGREADAPQIGGDMLGRGPALLLVRRIGRDRLDAQQREQPFETRVEIAVDPLPAPMSSWLMNELLRRTRERFTASSPPMLPSKPRMIARPTCAPTCEATERATCLTTTFACVAHSATRTRPAAAQNAAEDARQGRRRSRAPAEACGRLPARRPPFLCRF